MAQVNWSYPINWNHSLNKGLVSWWLNTPHGQGGIIWRDLVRQRQGTLTAMDPITDWATTDRLGGFGHLDFDDTEGEYVDLGSATLLTAGQPFSISWYENIHADTDAYPARFILDIAGHAAFYDIFRISTDVNYRYVGFAQSPIANGFQVEGATTPANAVGLWKHFMLTGTDPVSTNPANFAFYENGVPLLISQAAVFGTVTLNRIGYFASGTHGANCKFDDFQVWDRRLSAAEVEFGHQLSQQFYPGLLNRLPLRAFLPAVVAPAPLFPFATGLRG